MSSEKHETLFRRFFEELWDQHHMEIIDELVAENHVDHTAGSPPLPAGPEGVKQFASIYFTAFPDIRSSVEEIFADGERVVVRWKAWGTHAGHLLSIAPTNKPVTITGITIAHFANGQIVEQWTNFDNLGLLQQVGVVPALG